MIIAQITIKLEAPGLEAVLRHVGAAIIEGIRSLEVRAAEQATSPVVGSTNVIATTADVAPEVMTKRISRASLFTAERDELLATAWPAGVPPNEVMAAINSLPGPQVTIVQIGGGRTTLGWRGRPGLPVRRGCRCRRNTPFRLPRLPWRSLRFPGFLQALRKRRQPSSASLRGRRMQPGACLLFSQKSRRGPHRTG